MVGLGSITKKGYEMSSAERTLRVIDAVLGEIRLQHQQGQISQTGRDALTKRHLAMRSFLLSRLWNNI